MLKFRTEPRAMAMLFWWMFIWYHAAASWNPTESEEEAMIEAMMSHVEVLRTGTSTMSNATIHVHSSGTTILAQSALGLSHPDTHTAASRDPELGRPEDPESEVATEDPVSDEGLPRRSS